MNLEISVVIATIPDVRIWKHVDKNDPVPQRRHDLGPCWLWTSTTNKKGYGEFTWSPGKKIMAHRAMWLLVVGEIPEKLQLDHLCFITGCVRPSHLELVTNAENMARQVRFRLHCRNKHDLRIEGTVMRGRKRMCARCDRERSARFYAKHGGQSAYQRKASVTLAELRDSAARHPGSPDDGQDRSHEERHTGQDNQGGTPRGVRD